MKIFSWSLEPLCVIGVGWLLLFLNMEIPLDIVRSFMAGTLQAELAKAGFLPVMANALAVAANFLFWVVIYGMFYWGVTSFRSFFSLGPWRYFKERTWLGKFLMLLQTLGMHRPGPVLPDRLGKQVQQDHRKGSACKLCDPCVHLPAVVLGHRRAESFTLLRTILSAEEILGQGAGKIPQTP